MTPKSRQERFPGEWFYKCYQAVHRLGRDRTNMVKKIWKMLNIIPQFEARFETHMRWQGCRFGPESSGQTLVSPLFRSSLVPCVAACWGQICNLGVVIADSHISNNNWAQLFARNGSQGYNSPTGCSRWQRNWTNSHTLHRYAEENTKYHTIFHMELYRSYYYISLLNHLIIPWHS